MLYEFDNGRIITRSIEYSVAYHCNARCSGCSHLSPFAGRHFPSVAEFTADINRLSRVLHAGVIRLLGGEPLLNPDINRFIRAARESGIADRVMITTNGSLLHRMDEDFWRDVDYVLVSCYPDIPVKENLSVLRERARSAGTKLWFHPLQAFRTTVVTKPHHRDWITGMIFRTCRDVHLFHCHMVHEGKVYKCAVPPFLPEYLASLGNSEYDPARDAFDLYASGDLLRGLKRFLTSLKTMEACRYCLGYLGRHQAHHQLSPHYLAHPELQNVTRRKHLDRNKLLIESIRYFGRRALEAFNATKAW